MVAFFQPAICNNTGNCGVMVGGGIDCLCGPPLTSHDFDNTNNADWSILGRGTEIDRRR